MLAETVLTETVLTGTVRGRTGLDIASATRARRTRLLLTNTTNSLVGGGTKIPREWSPDHPTSVILARLTLPVVQVGLSAAQD